MASSNSNSDSLPPNHLGANVPEGFSSDFAAPRSNGKQRMAETNSTVQSVSADGVDQGVLDPNRSPSTGGGQKMSQLRGSRASISAPTKERIFNPHSENPGRIPMAGGVAVGSKQYEQRRASRVSGDMGAPSSSGTAPISPVLPEETAGKDEKPTFNMPDYSETNGAADTSGPPAVARGSPAPGESKQEDRPVEQTDKPAEAIAGPAMGEGATDTSTVGNGSAPATSGTEPNTEAPATAGVEDKSTVEKLKEKVKENVPTSGSNSSPAKERRQSRFGLLKEKLTGKKKD